MCPSPKDARVHEPVEHNIANRLKRGGLAQLRAALAGCVPLAQATPLPGASQQVRNAFVKERVDS